MHITVSRLKTTYWNQENPQHVLPTGWYAKQNPSFTDRAKCSFSSFTKKKKCRWWHIYHCYLSFRKYISWPQYLESVQLHVIAAVMSIYCTKTLKSSAHEKIRNINGLSKRQTTPLANENRQTQRRLLSGLLLRLRPPVLWKNMSVKTGKYLNHRNEKHKNWAVNA